MLAMADCRCMVSLTICKPVAWLTSILIGCSLGSATTGLLGQDAIAAEPDAAAQTQQPLQPSAPSWPTLQSLLNLPDWINLELDWTAEPMGGNNPTVNPAGAAAWIQQVVISSEFSSGLNKPTAQWQEFDHWKLALQLSSFSGNPNLNLDLGAAFPLQTTAHPVGLWLTEASLQRSAGQGDVNLKAGLLPLNPSFIENPSLDSYIHSALNNTLNLLIPGLPINPFVAPGAEVHWRPGAGHEIRIGNYWLDSETALASMLGVDPVQPDVRGTLQIVQWNLSRLPGSRRVADPIQSPQGPISRQLPPPLLQLGAFSTTASSDLAPAASNQGVYGSLTLPATLPIGLDNRLWIALSNGFNAEANPFPLFVAGGWLNQGLIPGRPLDVLAFGFGRTSFSPQLSPGTFEAVLELNYAISINAQLTLQPVIQWIANPGGGNAGPSAWAGGLQINLTL